MKCPGPEHAGSRVKLDGTYGKPGTGASATSARGRQAACVHRAPAAGGVLAGLLRALRATVERREGPQAPRRLPVRRQRDRRGVAGGGRRHHLHARLPRRPRSGPALSRSTLRPASCASPITASLSPTGWSSSRRSSSSPTPAAWPAEGSLLLDHLPFRVRALDAEGRRIPAGRVAFDVFCARRLPRRQAEALAG